MRPELGKYYRTRSGSIVFVCTKGKDGRFAAVSLCGTGPLAVRRPYDINGHLVASDGHQYEPKGLSQSLSKEVTSPKSIAWFQRRVHRAFDMRLAESKMPEIWEGGLVEPMEGTEVAKMEDRT